MQSIVHAASKDRIPDAAEVKPKAESPERPGIASRLQRDLGNWATGAVLANLGRANAVQRKCVTCEKEEEQDVIQRAVSGRAAHACESALSAQARPALSAQANSPGVEHDSSSSSKPPHLAAPANALEGNGGTLLLQRFTSEQRASRNIGFRSDGLAGRTVRPSVIPEESHGEPLDSQARAYMEWRFRTDFSGVRVHTDAPAAESAESLQADAYTTGSDIYFGAGRYAPHSSDGKHLLAHELAHTIQQAQGRTPALLASPSSDSVALSSPNDPLEAEAERAADAVMGVNAAATPVLAPVATEPARDTLSLQRKCHTCEAHAAAGDSGGVHDCPACREEEERSRAIPVFRSPKAFIQRKTKMATVLNPPPVAMTAGLNGLTFDVPVDYKYVAGPKSLQLIAMILYRLIGAKYSPELAEEVDAFLKHGGYQRVGGFQAEAPAKEGEKPEDTILLGVGPAITLTTYLEKKKLIVELTPEQRQVLVLGVGNTELWNELKKVSKEYDSPLPGWYDEAFFMAEMSNQGALLRRYTAAAIASTRDKDNAEAVLARHDIAADILTEIVYVTDVLEAIRKDTSLVKNDKTKDVYGRLFKLPDPIPDPLPAPTRINAFGLATMFLGYVRTQKKLADEAVATTEARAELLRRFAGYTQSTLFDAPTKPGAVTLREVPGTANYPALPSTISPSPALGGPLFDAALGTDHMFTMQIQFPDVYTALGRYNFRWERVRIPDDKIGKPVDVDRMAGEEATNSEVASVRFGRATRYAKEDIINTIESMKTDLGEEGIGALTLVGANAILRYIGEGIKFALESITTPLNAKHIVFPEAGLYMVRGIMSAALEGDEAVVRVPSVAYYPVLAREPEEMAKGGVTGEVDRRAKAKARIAEIEKKLAPDSTLSSDDRKALTIERDNLKVSLGSLTDILEARKKDVAQRIADIKSGKDQGDLESVEKQQKDLEKIQKLRAERKTEGAELLIASFAGDLGQKVALSLEAVDNPKTGDTFNVYVSDVTTPKSGAEKGSGPTRNDAIRAAVKEILGGISGYGRGYVSLLLDGKPETIRIAASKGALLMESVESIAMVLSVAAIAAAPFTGGASMVLLIPVGIAGAIPSAYRIYKKVDAGTWEWSLENAMDVVNIAASFIGFARAASASLKWVRLGKALLIVGYGVEAANGVLMGADLMIKIEELSKLEPGQREAALLMLLGQTMLQAGIIIGAKLQESAQQKRVAREIADTAGGKTPPPEKGPVVDRESGRIVESKVNEQFAAQTKDEQMAKLGGMDEDSRKRLEADSELRKALAESDLARNMLKKCASPCFPPEMTADQVRRLEKHLRMVEYNGGAKVDEAALKKYLYDRRNKLDAAIARLEGSKDAKSLNAWLEFYNTKGEEAITTVAPKEDPAKAFERTRRAHDHGVKFGTEAATKDQLRDVGYKNPFEKNGPFGQGFDDVRKKGGLPDMQLDSGDVYVTEYKGGEAGLAPGQMELNWVIDNIRRLYNEGGPQGQELARQLARALREGRLKGIAYSTPMTEPTSVVGNWDYGKVNIKL